MAPRRPTNNPFANRGAQQRAAGVNQQAQQQQQQYQNPIANAAAMRGTAQGQPQGGGGGGNNPGIISTGKGTWENNAQGLQGAQQTGAIRPGIQNQMQQHMQAGNGPQGQAYQQQVNNPAQALQGLPQGMQVGMPYGGMKPGWAQVGDESGANGLYVNGWNQGTPQQRSEWADYARNAPQQPQQPGPQGSGPWGSNFQPGGGGGAPPPAPVPQPIRGHMPVRPWQGDPKGPPQQGPPQQYIDYDPGPPPWAQNPEPNDFYNQPGGGQYYGPPGQGNGQGQGQGYQGPGGGNNFNDLWAEYERRQDRGYSGDKFMQNHPKFAENYGQMNKMFDQYRGGGGGGGGAPFRSSRSAAGGRSRRGYAAGQRRRGTTENKRTAKRNRTQRRRSAR